MPRGSRPAKRAAPSLDPAADFLGFEPEPEDTAVKSPIKDKRIPAAQKNRRHGDSRRRVIDLDLEEGDERTGAQPWSHYVSWHVLHDATDMINAELGAFFDYMTPTAAEHQLRSEIIASIAKAVARRYPDAQVLPFGSYATQSYLPFGDIDLVVVSPAIAAQKTTRVLFALSAMLQTQGLARDVTVIAKARVPILKFTSVRANVKIDISLNQESGLKAVPMVNTLLEDNGGRAARAMVAFIKAYLRSRDLNEVFSGGISSFSIICLVVSFLQMHPRVRTGQIDPAENQGLLLVEFFELYGKHFNYDVTGISVNEGGSYFGKDSKGWTNRTGRQMGLYLSIEDPGDENNDIAKGAYNTYALRQAFAAAYDALTAALHVRQEALSRSERSRRMPDFLLEPSLLGAVYAMSLEEITRRKQNAQEAAAATRDSRKRPAAGLPALQMQIPESPQIKRHKGIQPGPTLIAQPRPDAALDLPPAQWAKLADAYGAVAEASLEKKGKNKKKKERKAASKQALATQQASTEQSKQRQRTTSAQSKGASSSPPSHIALNGTKSTTPLSAISADALPEDTGSAAVARELGVKSAGEEEEEGEILMDESSGSESKYALHIRNPSNGSPVKLSKDRAAQVIPSYSIAPSEDDSDVEDRSDGTALAAARTNATKVRSFWAAKGPKMHGADVIEIDDSA